MEEYKIFDWERVKFGILLSMLSHIYGSIKSFCLTTRVILRYNDPWTGIKLTKSQHFWHIVIPGGGGGGGRVCVCVTHYTDVLTLLPNNKILDLAKLKQFADDKTNVT